jgi:hypothetical protein
MITRRIMMLATFGLVATAVPYRNCFGQSADQAAEGGLRNRGTPTGRVGAATRERVNGDHSLELVAPLHGVGLTSSDQPILCYLLSGPAIGPLRLVMSARDQVRPLMDLALPAPHGPSQLGVVPLRGRGVRLVANQLYTWSVAMVLDLQAPSHDLVASALIRYSPVDSSRVAATQRAVARGDYALLAASGYWYDAVAFAAENRSRDGGVALSGLLRELGLHDANLTG